MAFARAETPFAPAGHWCGENKGNMLERLIGVNNFREFLLGLFI
jgi:hypothetical protein